MVAIINQGSSMLIDAVPVDIRTGEFHTFTATPTAYATEAGTIRSDHIVVSPDTVSIGVAIGNLEREEGTAQGERAKTSLAALRRKAKKREIVDVLTTHILYKDMMISSIAAENVAPFDGTLVMRVTFTHMPQDKPILVTIPESQLPANDPAGVNKTAPGTEDGGRQEPVTPEDNRSLAAKIVDFF